METYIPTYMNDYIYVTSTKCKSCNQMLWTTAGSNPPTTINRDVVCSCGSTTINNNIVLGDSTTFTEEDFKKAVSLDTGIPESNINLVKWQ